MCLSVGANENSLSSDVRGRDLTVIMLSCPAVSLFNFSGVHRCNTNQTFPDMISSHLLFWKILFCSCLFVTFPQHRRRSTSPSRSPCPRSPYMLQVPSRHTLGTRAPNRTICYPHVSSMCVCGEAVSMVRVQIWASSLRPLSRLSTQESV